LDLETIKHIPNLSLEDVIENNISNSEAIGKYKGQDLFIKKGKYGIYAQWGKETKSLTRLRKLFEDALLKYGRKDNDGDLYLTADAWNEFTKESTWASDSARRTAISEAKKKLVDESMIEQKGAGYVVIDADMKAALYLMVKNS
jgi:topoisomerase IA-like protein